MILIGLAEIIEVLGERLSTHFEQNSSSSPLSGV